VRVLLIGDIVGKPGRQIIVRALPGLIQRERLDLWSWPTRRNAAGAPGLTPAIYHELLAAGVDCITPATISIAATKSPACFNSQPNIVKPANFPPQAARPRVAS